MKLVKDTSKMLALSQQNILKQYSVADAQPCNEHCTFFMFTVQCTMFTVHLQDSEGGLEARTGCGTWLPVPPVAGTVLVNVR